MPGALVTARVRSILSDGLLASFLTFFSGTVDPFHLGAEPGADWKKLFRCLNPALTAADISFVILPGGGARGGLEEAVQMPAMPHRSLCPRLLGAQACLP